MLGQATRGTNMRRAMVAGWILGGSLLLAMSSVAEASTAACRNTASFERWLDAFRKEAAEQGIKAGTIQSVLGGMTLDQGIIARDRGQRFFSQTFLEVTEKLANKNRQFNGARQIERHKAIFARAEKDYGVPAAIITAFWALESDFGVGMGKLPVLRSLVALAYDCRRGEMFRAELLAALRIIDRGDLKPADMIGSWAGELGQTQFLPSHYFNHAVDYDGDGRRDLLKSPADVIGSTAAFIQSLGWKRGQPWIEQVRVPARMDWKEADLAVQQPRSYWAKAGVTRVDGAALASDGVAASLLLPMGRNGPAFLAYENFQIYLKWNQSLNYAITAAYLATRLSGGPALRPGNAVVAPFGFEQVRQLQTLLARQGYKVGEIDGKLGAGTRAAVKQAQIKLGLPADSYPTPELLQRLGGSPAAERPAPEPRPRTRTPASGG